MDRSTFVGSCAAAVAACGTRAAAAQPEPKFAFRSGSWINLHHRLYRQAEIEGYLHDRRRLHAGEAEMLAAFDRIPADDRPAWNGAVETYRAQYLERDFVFDRELQRVDRALGELGDGSLDRATALPAPLRGALAGAGPVYRRVFWSSDDAGNRAWTAAARAGLAAYGSLFRSRLPRLFGQPWLAAPYHVDVAYDANWATAFSNYEDGYAQIVISSGPHGTQGNGAVELLFHEASHSLVDPDHGPVGAAIATAARRHGRPAPPGFWHALMFYTTEVLSRRAFAAAPQPYTALAVRNQIFSGDWAPYRVALERWWEPYMAGSGTLADAMSKCVDAIFAAIPAPPPSRS